MKKLLTILCLLFLIACDPAGKVKDGDLTMHIHGKDYKFILVRPAEGSNTVWVMYPMDSTDTAPIILGGKSGKMNLETIIIK